MLTDPLATVEKKSSPPRGEYSDEYLDEIDDENEIEIAVAAEIIDRKIRQEKSLYHKDSFRYSNETLRIVKTVLREESEKLRPEWMLNGAATRIDSMGDVRPLPAVKKAVPKVKAPKVIKKTPSPPKTPKMPKTVIATITVAEIAKKPRFGYIRFILGTILIIMTICARSF